MKNGLLFFKQGVHEKESTRFLKETQPILYSYPLPFQLIDRLSETTGIPAPAPLAGLDKREVRFGHVVEKEAMPHAVEAFLT